MIGAQAKQYALVLFLFGLFMGGIDNYAHAGGFIGGYAAASGSTRSSASAPTISSRLGCLAATALAILASLIKIGPQLLGGG